MFFSFVGAEKGLCEQNVCLFLLCFFLVCHWCLSEHAHTYTFLKNTRPHEHPQAVLVLRGTNYKMDCAIKTVNPNNGFFMCSTTDSTTKNGHVSHDAHIIAKSCCAPTCFSVRCAQTQVQLPTQPFRVYSSDCTFSHACTRRQLC